MIRGMSWGRTEIDIISTNISYFGDDTTYDFDPNQTPIRIGYNDWYSIYQEYTWSGVTNYSTNYYGIIGDIWTIISITGNSPELLEDPLSFFSEYP